jgi:hypothetical protein
MFTATVTNASDTTVAWSVNGVAGGSTDPGPAQFDGSYTIERLPVGHAYTVYAEPLDGVVSPAQINPAITSLCRNSTTDAGWPLLQDCVVPAVNIIFTTRT